MTAFANQTPGTLEQGCGLSDSSGQHTQALLMEEVDLSAPHPAPSPSWLPVPAPELPKPLCCTDVQVTRWPADSQD